MNRVSIGSDKGLAPNRRNAITSTNAGLLSIIPVGTNFSEIVIEIQKFSFTKMHLKIKSVKWQPFYPREGELTTAEYICAMECLLSFSLTSYSHELCNLNTIYRCRPMGIWIPIIKIRRSRDRLLFTMESHTWTDGLNIETIEAGSGIEHTSVISGTTRGVGLQWNDLPPMKIYSLRIYTVPMRFALVASNIISRFWYIIHQ